MSNTIVSIHLRELVQSIVTSKYRDMISELRRNTFDTDLLLSDQSCQDLSFRVSSVNTNEIIPISTINPRRFVLENSCKTLQQHCPLVKSSIEVTQILCILFYIGVEHK
ncbi:unnamed protein product [Rotaria sp. Silwood1]|nr:unnamed protein product [Rotaria sp. Silwood1]